MSSNDQAQLERVRRIVAADYKRMTSSDDPRSILKLDANAGRGEANARFEQFARFYRLERFEQLGDAELTDKAAQIRTRIARAVDQINVAHEEANQDLNAAATVAGGAMTTTMLADQFFTDGLKSMTGGDDDKAIDFFRCAVDYQPKNGVYLAYLAHALYRGGDAGDAQVQADLERACELEPESADVLILLAEFFIDSGSRDAAAEALDRVGAIDAEHPMLEKLRNAILD